MLLRLGLYVSLCLLTDNLSAKSVGTVRIGVKTMTVLLPKPVRAHRYLHLNGITYGFVLCPGAFDFPGPSFRNAPTSEAEFSLPLTTMWQNSSATFWS